MNEDFFFKSLKIIGMLVFMLASVLVLQIVEKRSSALIHKRIGFNQNPISILRSFFAAVVKSLFKEENTDLGKKIWANRLLFLCGIIFSFATFLFIPFNSEHFGMFSFSVNHVSLFALIILSLSRVIMFMTIENELDARNIAYTIKLQKEFLAIEYVFYLGLGSLLFSFNSINFSQIIIEQNMLWYGHLPRWGLFIQPLGAMAVFFSIYLTYVNNFSKISTSRSMYSVEGNKAVGYKFRMLKMILLIAACLIFVNVYLGGYEILGLSAVLSQTFSVPLAIIQFVIVLVKVILVIQLLHWIKWSIPQIKTNQLLSISWERLMPLCIFNAVISMLMPICIEFMK